METEHFLAQLSPMVMFGLLLRSSVRIAHPLWALDEAMQVYDRKTNCVQTLKRKPSQEGTQVDCTVVMLMDQQQQQTAQYQGHGKFY